MNSSMPSSDKALVVESLTKTYRNGTDTLKVLDNLDFTLEQGTTTVIMGKSGCGKSTFLHVVGGLDKPDSGIITASGVRVDVLKGDKLTVYRREHIGFIFQMHFLLEDFTALENLIVTAMIGGANAAEARRKSLQLLESVGLSQKTENYPGQLSGGERQRVAIARALINDPVLILADEPTGNLDEENSRIIEELLFSVVKKYNKSMLLVTHDANIARFADKSLVLTKGTFKE
ncbi:MAG: ABC transporter ATP-binding protein [Spirochaetia bacterium]|nr:ABC transporter ATP-binding protein [Spirochaetia bacterium]